jgi:hypothetical protein
VNQSGEKRRASDSDIAQTEVFHSTSDDNSPPDNPTGALRSSVDDISPLDHQTEDDASSVAVSETSTLTYSQEPFSTYQSKVSDLCESIGLGRPSSILRMHGGYYNRVIGLDFVGSDLPSCVIRIPRFESDEQEREITDQVSTLAFLNAK